MNRIYLLFLALMLGAVRLGAQCDPVADLMAGEMVYDEPVTATRMDSNVLYTAGSFKLTGRYSGHFSALDSLGRTIAGWPKFSGTDVYGYAPYVRFVPDGHQGFIAYGHFSLAGTVSCNNLAWLDSAGTVKTGFLPNVNDDIEDAIVVNDTLYMVGAFSAVNGNVRGGIASISLATGSLLPLNCTKNGPFYCIQKKDDTLYVGGRFSLVNGTVRSNLVALLKTSGAVTSFNIAITDPTYTPYVRRALVIGDTLLLTGAFRGLGDSTRLNAGSVTLSSRKPNHMLYSLPDGDVVNSLASYNDTLYMAGRFKTVNDSARQGICLMKISTGKIAPQSVKLMPSTTDAVYAVYPSGNRLYIAGDFASINDSVRYRVAVLDRNSAVLLPIKRDVIGLPYCLQVAQGRLLIAGKVVSAQPVRRSVVAAYDLDADTILPWQPSGLVLGQSEFISTMEVSKSQVYVGGYFQNQLGTSVRSNIASFSKTTGALSSFNPYADNKVYALRIWKSRLYVGGIFAIVNTTLKRGLAAVDTGTGTLFSWNPSTTFQNGFTGFEFVNDTMITNGGFYQVGGSVRQGLAAINLISGASTAWNPNPNSYFNFMKLIDTNLYVSGNGLTSIGGATRNQFAAVSSISGNATGFNPAIHWYGPTAVATYAYSARIVGVEKVNNRLYVAGIYDSVNGNPRFCMSAIDAATGTTTSTWHPVNAIPEAIFRYGNRLYFNGTANFVNFTLSGSLVARGVDGIFRYILPDVVPQGKIRTDSTILCIGDTARLAVSSNIATGASYQWMVNGVNAGANSRFFSFVPANGDSVNVFISGPSFSCASGSTTSAVKFNVNPNVTPGIFLTAPGVAAPGLAVNCLATINNVVSGYRIDWFVNGVKAATTAGNNFSYTKGAGVDTVTALLHNPAGCYDTGRAQAVIADAAAGITATGFGSGYTAGWLKTDRGGNVLIQAAEGGAGMFRVVDATGRLVRAQSLQVRQGQNAFPVTDLAPGAYVLSIEMNGVRLRLKIVL